MRRAGRVATAILAVGSGLVAMEVMVSRPTTVDTVVEVLPTYASTSLPTPSGPSGPSPSPTPTGTHSPSPTPTGSPSASPSRTPAPGGRTAAGAGQKSGGGSHGVVPLIRAGAPVPTKGADGAPAVGAEIETQLFPGESGDTADDSAIWRNPSDPARSLVVADDKSENGGVGVFDLRGKLVNYSRTGKIGNIDLRSGVRLGGRSVTLVGANDRTTSTLRFWTLSPSGALTSVEAGTLSTISPNYGFCLGRSADHSRTYAFVTAEKSGDVEQYQLGLTSGRVQAVKVRTLHVGSLSEGCAVDDVRGAMYIGEEDVGIWRYDLDPATGQGRTSVDQVGEGRISADVEGVAVARGPRGAVLVVSSQGDSSYAVYDLEGHNAFRGNFSVGDDKGVDGVTHTDGVALAGGDFGSAFPDGLLVVHDGENDDGGHREGGSNLKFLRFDEIVDLDG